jgi:hypothetical protein
MTIRGSLTWPDTVAELSGRSLLLRPDGKLLLSGGCRGRGPELLLRGDKDCCGLLLASNAWWCREDVAADEIESNSWTGRFKTGWGEV